MTRAARAGRRGRAGSTALDETERHPPRSSEPAPPTVLHLVRHGRPAIDPSTPASRWRLREDAAVDVRVLRDTDVLPHKAMWFSSPEPRALETAVILHPGAPVHEAFREAERGTAWLGADVFVAAVRRAFEVEEAPGAGGWEPLAQTRRRVVAAAAAAIGQSRGAEGSGDVVLVGHGTAWTLLVADLTCSPPDLARWEQMTMPDHCSIDVERGSIVSHWGQWRDGAGSVGP
jgi:broad specificity phosphatase PhoE